jgi:hypothetical protein
LTGEKSATVSTGSGRYVLSLLQPGTYDVNVAAPGFAGLTQQHIVVVALATFALDLKLTLGATTQNVVVTDEPPTLQTEDLKLGSNINNETYDSLPLAQNGAARDPSAFIGLAVGVNSFSVQAAGPSTASFNGGQTYQNETYIEGLALSSAGTESDTRNLAFGISVEAVDQFQVAVTGNDAAFEGQGVSNFIIKSGGNKFHGGYTSSSAIRSSTPRIFSPMPPRSSTKMSLAAASAARYCTISCSSLPIMTGTATIQRPRRLCRQFLLSHRATGTSARSRSRSTIPLSALRPALQAPAPAGSSSPTLAFSM